MTIHKPVLLKEVIESFSPQPNENFIDATIGGGGHALAILEKTSPNGRLLGIDLSEEAIQRLKLKTQNSKLKNRIILVQDNFINLTAIVKKYNFQPVNGIIIDLGLSSDFLETSGKGFSFQKDEFLDMRFGETGRTSYEIINQSSLQELEKIFKEYGEEKFSDLIAQQIIKSRRQKEVKTTGDLTMIISEAIKDKVPEKFRVKVFARIFQALRISVNNELENLKKVLWQSIEILVRGGRIGVISFHSLEDRIVKNFFREKKKQGILKILTKKPIRAGSEELKNNPRSRSAKFRLAEKIIIY